MGLREREREREDESWPRAWAVRATSEKETEEAENMK